MAANNEKQRKVSRIEAVGLVLVIFSMAMLFLNAGAVGGLFNAMFNRAFKVVVPVYVTGSIGCAIIISVTMGRILERLGFTDALVFASLSADGTLTTITSHDQQLVWERYVHLSPPRDD